jgi:hypothetical protein
VPLLKELDDSDLHLLASHFRKQKFKRGSVVMRQGDGVGEESMFYYLDQGVVDIYVDGAKVVSREQGSYFGERGLIEDTPRNASIIAETDLVCLCLSRGEFRNLAESHYRIRTAFGMRDYVGYSDGIPNSDSDRGVKTNGASRRRPSTRPSLAGLEGAERNRCLVGLPPLRTRLPSGEIDGERLPSTRERRDSEEKWTVISEDGKTITTFDAEGHFIGITAVNDDGTTTTSLCCGKKVQGMERVEKEEEGERGGCTADDSAEVGRPTSSVADAAVAKKSGPCQWCTDLLLRAFARVSFTCYRISRHW